MSAFRERQTGRLRTLTLFLCRLPAITTLLFPEARTAPDSVKSVELHQLTKDEGLSPCVCKAAGIFFPVFPQRFTAFWLSHSFLSFVSDFNFTLMLSGIADKLGRITASLNSYFCFLPTLSWLQSQMNLNCVYAEKIGEM